MTGLSLLFAAQAALAAEPVRLPLFTLGRDALFIPHSVAFSPDGAQVCIAGTELSDAGEKVRLALVDRARNAVAWQTIIPAPAPHTSYQPVQCLFGKDRLYLLADAVNSLVELDPRFATQVLAFDMHGKPLAAKPVTLPRDRAYAVADQYGYAIGEAAEGLVVHGYTREHNDDQERYSVYTVTLDAQLEPHGAPLVRAHGAYAGTVDARLIGDTLYIAGRFFAGSEKNNDVGEYAASRLRNGGGYLWSTRTGIVNLDGVRSAVAEDGSSYLLGHLDGTTVLAHIQANGKAVAPLRHASPYCTTAALSAYGDGLLAVRQSCKGQGHALVAIDSGGREQPVAAIRDEPLYVATHGAAWAVLARDAKSTLYFEGGAGAADLGLPATPATAASAAAAPSPRPAFAGTVTFTAHAGGADHTLALSNWQVDRWGLPSFDYVYEQHAGACRFRIDGRAAGFGEDVQGKMRQAVFHGKDGQGHALPATVEFTNSDVGFTLPDEPALRTISLGKSFSRQPTLHDKACARDRDGELLPVTFTRPAP